MKKIIFAMLLTLMFSMPLWADHHEEAEPEDAFVYASYFYCSGGDEADADAEVETLWKPVYDKSVAEGRNGAWGYYVHHTGGMWRRLSFQTANSLEALLEAQAANGAAMDEAAGEDAESAFGKSCWGHDDYIWQVTNGSPTEENDAKVAHSVYMECSFTGEERADEIVANDYAAIYNKYVEAGKIDSWGWLSHVIGGKYRKLQTMTGSDHASLLAARGEILGEILALDASEEFSKICTSHSDYMWNIVH